MTYKKIINRSITWADKDQNIFGLFIVGSRARELSPEEERYSTYLVKKLLKSGVPGNL